MASVMAISFVLNGPSMEPPPRPILKPLGYMTRNLPPLQECIVQANASHLHSTAPTTGDPFTCLNAALDGSKLIQMTHKRSPYGPDFGYEKRDYPGMDGLLYRMYDPEPSSSSDYHFGAQQQYVEGANLGERREHVINDPDHGDYPQQQPNNITNSQHWAAGYDRMADQESRLPPKNYQDDGQYWNPIDLTATPDNVPVSDNIRQLWEFIDLTTLPDGIPTPIKSFQSEDSPLSPVYDYLGQIASNFAATYAEELFLSPRQLLPITERRNLKPDPIPPRTPYSRHTDQIPAAPRSKKHREAEQHAKSFSEYESSPAPEEEKQQITPPGYTIDYFTKKPRKMRMTDSRAQLRKQFDGFVEKPIDQRPQGVYWEEGDSEMEFSEWEEVNRATERMKRKEKERRKERKSKLRKGGLEVGLRG